MQQENKIFAEFKYNDDRLKLRELFPGVVSGYAEVFNIKYYMVEDGQSLFMVSWIEKGVVQNWKLGIPLLTICVAREIAV